jgi:hypothetical protein
VCGGGGGREWVGWLMRFSCSVQHFVPTVVRSICTYKKCPYVGSLVWCSIALCGGWDTVCESDVLHIRS